MIVPIVLESLFVLVWIQISGSVKILVYLTWLEVLMLVLGRYMLEVYSPGRCIKNRPVKVSKMAAIQDGHQNFELHRTEGKIPILGFIAFKFFKS